MPTARFFAAPGVVTGDFPGTIPVFTASITETSLAVGQTATLTVNGPVESVQWLLDGVEIPGATNLTYLTTAVGELTCDVDPLGPQPVVTTAGVTVAAGATYSQTFLGDAGAFNAVSGTVHTVPLPAVPAGAGEIIMAIMMRRTASATISSITAYGITLNPTDHLLASESTRWQTGASGAGNERWLVKFPVTGGETGDLVITFTGNIGVANVTTSVVRVTGANVAVANSVIPVAFPGSPYNFSGPSIATLAGDDVYYFGMMRTGGFADAPWDTFVNCAEIGDVSAATDEATDRTQLLTARALAVAANAAYTPGARANVNTGGIGTMTVRLRAA